MSSPIPAVLSATELFEDFSAAHLAKLSTELEWIRLLGGDTLFQQGELGDCLYIVVAGRLRALLEKPNGSQTVLGEAGYGETCGEMALLTGAPRSATVRAVRDSELLRLSKDSFEKLVETHANMALGLARRIITRYDRVMGGKALHYAGNVATIAVIGVSAETPPADFTRRLVMALGAAGSVLYLDHAALDAALGEGSSQIPRDHSRNHAIVSWLSDQESKHRFVVYQADPQPSAWSSRCLRQADRILIVGRPHDGPELGPVELAMSRQAAGNISHKELVLLHAEAKPLHPGTRAWLDVRQVHRHHHVVESSEADFARLVRLLTGTATGVVLGGGGARSFAQIGMLSAMQEAGIAIDLIGGTSMGSFLGAQWAMGWDAARMQEYNGKTWRHRWPIRDYNFPFMSLIAGRRFEKVARGLYGESQIEDLSLNYFACSSNLTRADIVVHRRGPIWRALSASIAVPGLAPPLFENGDLLVDGAALDNLPIDIMRQACEGTVVAMDVSPLVDLAVDADLRMGPSAWQIAYKKFTRHPDRLRLPSIIEILSRASGLGSVRQVERLKREANLYLHPPIEKYSIFDFKLIDEMVKVGYDYAVQALRGWKESKPAPVAARKRVTTVY